MPEKKYPLIDELLAECDAYRAAREACGARPWKETTLSQYMFGHGRHIGELRAGRDMGYRLLTDARTWLRAEQAKL